MKHIYKFIFLLIVTAAVYPTTVLVAGNPDRAGQAGATELLINPWARSSGWGNANTGSVHGLEAIFGNVAGIAFTKKTDVLFSHTQWLKGSEININSFGFSQKMGESSVLGLAIMAMDFGDIPVTTVDNPDGGLGTFSPRYMNINFAYAKIFSHSIYGGINLKVIDESISNVSASGFAVDAGIQYVTGSNEDKDNLKFGISLKNVGTPMSYGGDGLSTRVTTTNNYELTVEHRSAGFEVPSLVNIGATYDIHPAKDHRVSIAGTFTSNSFTQDQYTLGLEYGFKNYFMIRGGFTYEENVFDDILRTSVFTGPAAGFTLELPLGKSGKSFGLDYSYRATNPFSGTHSFGARFSL
ncbi:MAG: PorV/PorQ family protein [Bacteroidetes bacterium]|nr:PorV/PorQ family protein [Bacteroidota bacterium]